MMRPFREKLEMNIIAIEYPGYGLYTTKSPDDEQIEKDAELLYK